MRHCVGLGVRRNRESRLWPESRAVRVFLATFALLSSCREEPEATREVGIRTVWRSSVPETGLSSPMVTDLNSDGISDVIVGHGIEGKRGGLTAVDGRTGSLLWSCQMADEVFTTTPLLDLNGDGVNDPVVGGRTLNLGLTALDGRNGARLWFLGDANPGENFPNTNFNTPVRLPDQDGDGIDDLLVGQSGGQDDTRPPARYHLVSGKTGQLL